MITLLTIVVVHRIAVTRALCQTLTNLAIYTAAYALAPVPRGPHARYAPVATHPRSSIPWPHGN